MFPFRDSRLIRIAIAIFFLVVLAYAYYEGRGVLFGPKITIVTRELETSDEFVTIKGRAEHITSLLMNGHPVSVTEDGSFEEPYVLAPGSNRIVFEAQDKYGSVSEKVVEIVLTGTTSAMMATSSPINHSQSTSTPAAETSSSSPATTTPSSQ